MSGTDGNPPARDQRTGNPQPGDPPTGNPIVPRVFYSTTTANEFLTHLTTVLAEQQRTLIETLNRALLEQQESFLRQLNESLTLQRANARRASQSLSQSPRTSPTDDEHLSSSRGFTPGTTSGVSREPSPLPPITPSENGRNPAVIIRSPTHERTALLNESASNAPIANVRVPGIKLTKFYGNEDENVLAWLHSVKQFFKLNGVTEENKVATASSALRKGAKSFFYYLVVTNQYKDPSWRVFEREFIAKYENAAARGDFLRDKLQRVRYHGISKMAEYCEEFRSIESQIYDMAFSDRLLNFSRPIPPELAMHLRNSDLRSKDMEVVYQLARQWATSAVINRALQASSHRHHRLKHREGKSLLQFRKKKRKDESKRKDDSDSDDSVTERLDRMERQIESIEQFNRIDMQSVICYNCGK